MTLHCILFDLDGTLLDTLPDLARALNGVLVEEGRDPLAESVIRQTISQGAPGMVKLGFGEHQDKVEFARRTARLREIYSDNLNAYTRLFPGMDDILRNIEARNLKWGVVTNKRRYLTVPLLERMGLLTRAHCVVSGDDTTRGKPNPDPLWRACRLAGVDTCKCVYIGDAKGDIEAGRRAGMMTVAACYGYLAPEDDPRHWGADRYIEQPGDLMDALADVLPPLTVGDPIPVSVIG